MTDRVINAQVSSEIVLRVDELDPVFLEQVRAALSFENEDKKKQAALNIFGWWDLPDVITMWREERRRGGDHVLLLPRGFAAQLMVGATAAGYEIRWQDLRSSCTAAPGYFRPFVLRDYQLQAVLDMLAAEQGIYRAPAGCVIGDTKLRFNRAGKGFERDIADAYHRFHGLRGKKSWDRSIPTYCRALVDGVYKQHIVEDIVYSGPKSVIEVELESGKTISCTREHGVLTKQGWVAAGQLEVGSIVTVNGQETIDCLDCGKPTPAPRPKRFPSSYTLKYPGVCISCRGSRQTESITMQIILDKNGYLQERAPDHPRANSHKRVLQHILVAEAVLGRYIGRHEHVHHKNKRRDDNWPDNLEVVTPKEHHRIHRGFLKMDGGTAGRGGKIVFIPKYEKVVAIRDAGVQETYDMVMQDPHNNFIANGIVVHNSGKTTTALGLMTYAQQRTIVVTDKAFLLEQWRERAAQFLGLSLDYDDERSVGKIGAGVWEERELTICLRQTLWSRLWELKSTGWFKRVGLVFVDESHHLAADTIQEIVREIPSKMFYGVSATPARTPMQGQVIGSLVGPIVAETTRQALYERGVLMRPTLRVVNTDIDVAFWKDHDSDQNGNCQNPGCYKKTPHSHRNNYSSVLKTLVEDEDRNRLIARQIISERGHVHLVPSSQLKHLNLIRRALIDEGWDGPIYLLRGEENARGDSQKIVSAIEAGGVWKSPPVKRKVPAARVKKLRAEAEATGEEFVDPNERPWEQVEPVGEHGHEAVVLSTVAGEGMDVPMIDRNHIVFPIRQEAATIQLVGRGERVAPGKEEYVLTDYHDHRVTVFTDQFAERLRTYRWQSIADEVVEQTT